MGCNTIKNNHMKEQELKKDHLLTGKMMSANHYTKGKSDQSEMFSGGCVFIEHVSGYARIKHQVAINDTENVKAKITFDREDKSQGVMINVYHNDTGIFNTSKFMEKLLKNQKKISFSGASTSHQNGAAERAIKTVVNMVSTILMQAWMICHKDTFSIDFGQRKCTMLYVYKVGSLIYSMLYKPLGKFEPYMFWSQGFRSLE